MLQKGRENKVVKLAVGVVLAYIQEQIQIVLKAIQID